MFPHLEESAMEHESPLHPNYWARERLSQMGITAMMVICYQKRTCGTAGEFFGNKAGRPILRESRFDFGSKK